LRSKQEAERGYDALRGRIPGRGEL
jgi:hypothetical protein